MRKILVIIIYFYIIFYKRALTRLYWFPLKVIYHISVSSPSLAYPRGATFFLTFFLLLLAILALNIYWFYVRRFYFFICCFLILKI